MEIAAALAVAAEQPRAVLSTRRASGDPQLSPVVVAVRGEALLVSTRETAIKAKNLARDPRASLCVLPNDFFGRWVQLDCTARIVPLPDAMELLVEYYRLVSGEHPDWAEYRATMERERRVALVLTPQRAGPDRSG